MEAWTGLYLEIAKRISDNLPEIAWVDLWHEQIQYLTTELPFPVPAIFIAFNTKSCDDQSLLIQDCDTQIDMYLFYETFSDTYQGAYNQENALDYLLTLTKIHTLFHGVSGNNFGTMRRVDMKKEDSGGAGNLYRISFASIIEDASAMQESTMQAVNEINVQNEPISRPSPVDDTPLYIIPM
jgi:hypothetical protein